MNFTAADLLFSGAAFLLFAIFLIPPGYALGWALDLISFRRQGPGMRLVLSLPLSIALTPVLVYLIGRASLGWPVWWMYGIFFAAFLAVFRWRGLKIPRAAWVATGCWAGVSFLSLADLQIGKQLYYSVVAYDYNFRSAVTGAFVRAQSLPAANPLFFDGTPQPFRYHYFWFLMCALPVRLAYAVFGYTGLTARHAVIASSAWGGLALLAMLALYVRFFLRVEEPLRKRVTTIAFLLIGVYGLDIVPDLLEAGDGFYPTIDWWNGDQVTGWLDSLLWVPHSMGSLTACLTGFLVLWEERRFRWPAVLGAGLAFASAAGLSVYVTLAFAFFVAIRTVWLMWERKFSQAVPYIGAGAVAVPLALPFLSELAGRPGSQGSFAMLAVRHFQPAIQALDAAGWLNFWTGTIANLLLLPVNYFIELGFFFVAGAAWFAARKWTLRGLKASELAAAQMLMCALVFCSFIRSNTIQMNDLGARGFLIVQFILVLWGAEWLARGGGRGWLAKATLAIGLAGTIFEIGMLRVFPVLADREILTGTVEIDPNDDLGLRDFGLRQIYETLDRTLPRSAVVQHNPSGEQDIPAGLYANRQFAIMDLSTAITFTGDRASPARVLGPLKELFAGEREDAAEVCRELHIDVLVVKDVDPAWEDGASWVWRLPVLAKSEMARALDCRRGALPGRLQALPEAAGRHDSS